MSRKTFTFLLINVLFVFSSLSLEAQNPQNADKNTRYLALGDSLAFGYNPLIQPPNLSNYVGYPDIVSQSLHLTMANASCPGETSGTFVGSSSTFLPGFNCIPLQSDGGLFVPYNGAPTQLAYAVNYLQSNPNPQLVTINIGVNDIGLLQANCTAATPTNAAAIATCETTGLPAVLSTFGQNLATIYQELRATGYTGPIVALNAAPFNYSDPQQLLAFTSLNLVISEVSSKFNVSVANVFQAFATASAPYGGDTCEAGLLLKLANGTCDTHPNSTGQSLLASTVVSATPKK